ncbi:MAG TPA: hypothetical protein VD837_02000 [Terriglobales bacterium]|nr:hypothetical protein [Terriglobales bacterium]
MPAIQVNSTPRSGAIYKFIIYDNGKKMFEGEPYQTGVVLYDGALRNGFHNLVVNAWDTSGNLLQSKISFTVVGYGYPLLCSVPASPGINFCVPPANSLQQSGIPVSATAKGHTRITAMQVYVDGKLQTGQQGYHYLSTGVFPSGPGTHRITVVAYDSTGHRFASTKTVRSTYDAHSCPPKGNNPCSPGFVVEGPMPDEFVGASFTVKAQILNNPKPITAIKVYLDARLIAESNGPTLYQSTTTEARGTHILTFQAWDTDGNLYRVQQNVNIGVPH